MILKKLVTMCLLYVLVQANLSCANPQLWQQTLAMDATVAKELIQDQIGLQVTDILQLGAGWDNIAYLVNKQYVFRFPRRPIGVICMENEICVLPYIKQHVSFTFSSPDYIGTFLLSDYIVPFAGYEIVPGISLSDTDAKEIDDIAWAKKLACWLKELHTIPVRPEDYANIQDDTKGNYAVSRRSERVLGNLQQYAHHFQAAGFEVCDLIAALDRFKAYDFTTIAKTSYCHGDLYSRHILIDNNLELSGIIDWGGIHIGNPGIDLSVGFMMLSDDALSAFLQEYGAIDADGYRIALFKAFCHSAILLFYSYEEQEDGLKQWATLTLKKTMERIDTFLFKEEF